MLQTNVGLTPVGSVLSFIWWAEAVGKMNRSGTYTPWNEVQRSKVLAFSGRDTLILPKLDVEAQAEWLVCSPRNQANHGPLGLPCYISTYPTQ